MSMWLSCARGITAILIGSAFLSQTGWELDTKATAVNRSHAFHFSGLLVTSLSLPHLSLCFSLITVSFAILCCSSGTAQILTAVPDAWGPKCCMQAPHPGEKIIFPHFNCDRKQQKFAIKISFWKTWDFLTLRKLSQQVGNVQKVRP